MIKKASIHSRANPRKINPTWFTGKVGMTDISGTIKSDGQNIYHVSFKNGARTKLHAHNGDQILYATAGIGSLEIFSKKGSKRKYFAIKRVQKVKLLPGNIVFIPRGVLHTHGATGKKTFSHIAFNILAIKEFKTVWYESDFKKLAHHIIK
jgi:quercetin dioxygenase-like cupin family protein